MTTRSARFALVLLASLVIDSHGAAPASRPLNDDVGPLAQDYIVIALWMPLHVARNPAACRSCQSLLP